MTISPVVTFMKECMPLMYIDVSKKITSFGLKIDWPETERLDTSNIIFCPTLNVKNTGKTK